MRSLLSRSMTLVLVVALVPALAGSAWAAPAAPTTSPEGARPVGAERGVFATLCRFSHEAADDPIVFPGQAGKSHLHTFFGNTTTSAASTYESLRAGADDLPHRGGRLRLLGAGALSQRRRGQTAGDEGVLPDRPPRAGVRQGVPGRLPGGRRRRHGDERPGHRHDVLALSGPARPGDAAGIRADGDAPHLPRREPADAPRPLPGSAGTASAWTARITRATWRTAASASAPPATQRSCLA